MNDAIDPVALGLAAYRRCDLPAAVREMRRALAADPHNGAAASHLAVFCFLAGDTEGALARLRAVVALDPSCVAARLALAEVLLHEGEHRDVLELLDGAPPGGGEGRQWHVQRTRALCGLGRWADAAAELGAIPDPCGDELAVLRQRLALAVHGRDEAVAETLAARLAAAAERDEAALPEPRVAAHFDVARFHHRRRRFDAAFAQWTAGHRLLGRMQPFSRERFRGFVDAAIVRFDAARLAGVRAANRDPAPVFIVGMPRSGTTLTEQVLGAHPAVFAAGERPALYRLAVRLASGRGRAAETVHRLADLPQAVLDREAAAYLDRLHALAPGACYVTDKMPDNALRLGFAACLLPGAKVILCRRDPRDIGLSIFQHRFFGYHPYAHDPADLGWYLGEHERLMAHWRAVLPLPLLTVDLADWVADFAGTLSRVLEFLGLPPDPACERFYQAPRRARTVSAAQVRRPINALGLGRWRDYAAQLAPMLAELEAAGLVAGAARKGVPG